MRWDPLVALAATFCILFNGAHGLDRSKKKSDLAGPVLVPLRRYSIIHDLGEDNALTNASYDKSDAVPATRQIKAFGNDDSFYVGRLLVGQSQLQILDVSFDTSSGQLLLPSLSCQSLACSQRHHYDPLVSSSSVYVNVDGSRRLLRHQSGPGSLEHSTPHDQISVGFSSMDLGDGRVTGSLVADQVCVGALRRGDHLACVKMGLVAASAMTDLPFLKMPYDGIIGLGLSSLSASPVFNFLDRLSVSGSLTKRAFGLYFGDAGGELSLGGYNPSRLVDSLTWLSASRPEQGYWQVQIRTIRIGNRTLSACDQKTNPCWGIVDSSASRIGVPSDFMPEFTSAFHLSSVPAASGLGLLCTGPNLSLELEGGVILTLEASDYAAPVSSSCEAKVAPVSLPTTFASTFVLGHPVLRRYYTAFEWEGAHPFVGFGQATRESLEEAVTAEHEEAILGQNVIALEGLIWGASTDLPMDNSFYRSIFIRAIALVIPELLILIIAMSYVAAHLEVGSARLMNLAARFGLPVRQLCPVKPLLCSEVPSDAECVICLGSIEEIAKASSCKSCHFGLSSRISTPRWCRLRCGHYFHEDCVFQWLARTQQCPVCRSHAFRSLDAKPIKSEAAAARVIDA